MGGNVAHVGTTLNVSIGTSAASLVAANQRRKSILIQNVHGTNTLYVSTGPTPTSSNAIRISPGEAIEFTDYIGPLYAIASGASTDVRYMDIGGYST